jgi:hypothetical protein
MAGELGDQWDERMAPCVHEAAHAVIAADLGVFVFEVVVAGDGEGAMTPDVCSDEQQVYTALAGSAAEMRYCKLVGFPPDPGRRPEVGRWGDHEHAWAAAQRARPDDIWEARDFLANARVTVDQKVETLWESIVRLALELYRKSSISGDNLYRTIFGPPQV